jgi:membrane protein YqaA with SNARE-associated domain
LTKTKEAAMASQERRRTERNGYDIAYVAVMVIGIFLTALIIVLGLDLALNRGTQLSDNGQIVIVSGLGTIGSIAGGALGYWVGGTTERRRMPTDPEPPVIDPTATGGDPGVE